MRHSNLLMVNLLNEDGVFDRSTSFVEHLSIVPDRAKSCILRRNGAILTAFGISMPNARPTGIRTAAFVIRNLLEKYDEDLSRDHR